MYVFRLVLPLLSVMFALSPSTATAAGPPSRLHGRVREGTRVVLPGSTPVRVQGRQDLGPVSSGQPLHGMTLVFRRSDAQQAALVDLLAAQGDPASPLFHRWLSPESFGQQFGMAEADLLATKQWLTEQGFAIDGVSRARDRISFSGTAQQVAAAFSTTLHTYRVDGELHMSPGTRLSLPADLAEVTRAVLHLSDFRPAPKARLSPRPLFSTADTRAHYLTPQDLQTMYNLPAENSTGYEPGSGQTIAVVGQSYVNLSFGAPIKDFLSRPFTHYWNPVLVPGTGVQAVSPIDAVESEIDLEYVGGLLPAANVLLVYVGSDPHFGVFDALAFAIDGDVAPVISISYGLCETLLSADDIAQGDALFQQAAAQGQTLVAASGDAGSTGCAVIPASGQFTAAQQGALAVDFPADSAFVTAVGGTQMTPDSFAADNVTFWMPATPPNNLPHSLISYVPEITWNEDSAFGGLFAGGGGASASLPRPAWQANLPGIPTGSTRLLPDLAFQSSSANPGFLFCTDVPEFVVAGQNTGCSDGQSAAASYPVAGGTSFAAPTFAAMVALLNQDTGALGQGNINPVLYRLAGNANTAGTVFHDITAGTIACPPGVPSCSAEGQTGFAAAAGYDQATGLGSLDYGQLRAAWPVEQSALDGTVTALVASFPAVQPGDTDIISISVGSPFQFGRASTSPTGGVSVAVDGAVVSQALPLSTMYSGAGSSTASFDFVAPAEAGSHVVVVTYGGDSTHGPSAATATVMVGNVLASGSIALAAGDVTIPGNGSASTGVSITPSGGYNGRLTWSLSLSSATNHSFTACYTIPSTLVQGVTSVTLLLGTGTACSSALSSGRSARPLTLMKAASQHARAQSQPHQVPWPAIPAAAGVLLCCVRFRSRLSRSAGLFCVLLVATASAISGCGGGGSGSGTGATTPPPNTTPPPSTTPPAGATNTYTVTLTGTDSVNAQVASSTTFTLTVQ